MLVILSNLVRILLVLFLIRLVGRAVAAWLRSRPAAAPRPQARPSPASRELVRDQVCNTFVPRERALQATVDGNAAYFCSPACRDRALATRAAS